MDLHASGRPENVAQMLPRVLETEVMDTPDEAADYDAMDHIAVNAAFCADFLAGPTVTGEVLDLGTGTARIPIELCARAESLTVVAVDLAEHMLEIARVNVARAGLEHRIRLQRVDAKGTPFADGSFAAVISNSIVHHIPDPTHALAEMWRLVRPSGRLFVRDLFRPETEADVARLVTQYGGSEPADRRLVPAFERQRELFRASLCAALTVDEVAAIVRPLGITAERVAMTSDRHWTLSATKP